MKRWLFVLYLRLGGGLFMLPGLKDLRFLHITIHRAFLGRLVQAMQILLRKMFVVINMHALSFAMRLWRTVLTK
jgi:hypothetical protein